MLPSSNFQSHAARLADPAETADARRALVAEVRDAIEVIHSPEYGTFLHYYFPAFQEILTVLTKPQREDSVVHKTRSIVLEILGRLPHNEYLRPYAPRLLHLVMEVLRTDNEVNAVNAIHIIFDLHKNFRTTLESDVQPFMDFVRQLYATFGEAIASAFPHQPDMEKPLLTSAVRSFKVLIECPVIVMFLFQLYPARMKHNISALLPFMVKSIEFRVPADQVEQASKGTYQDFVGAQVKTVSFLSFLLKQCQDMMKPYEQTMPSSVVQLLQACPGDAVSIRKDLLVATRHILATPLRVGFFGHIGLLLNERVLVGSGRAAYETLRPLAYSFLAELVFYVRMDLPLEQLSRIIYMFSTNVHDRTLSYTIQTTSVRLLLNLFDGMLKKHDAELRPRQLLIRIMHTIVYKFSSIASQVPRLLNALSGNEDCASSFACRDSSSTSDPRKEINDCKHLIKTLTLGLKTVVWSVLNVKAPPASTAGVHTGKPGMALGSSQFGGVVNAPAGASKPSAGGNDVPPSSQRDRNVSSTQTNVGHAAKSQGDSVVGGLNVPSSQASRSGLLEQECELLARLVSSSRQCFRLYNNAVISNFSSSSDPTTNPARADSGSSQVEKLSSAVPAGRQEDKKSEGELQGPSAMVTALVQRQGSGSFLPTSGPSEEKEILETFAQIFTVLDVRSFQDVFGLRMPELFEHVVENPAAIAIPQHFLQNNNISKYFADILLNFLISHMSELGSGPSESTVTNEKRAQALLRLFRILFASVSLFPRNEPVFKPHLNTIVRDCLFHASRCNRPAHFLSLLRALFRSLNQGKPESQFELLYREFAPHVESVLDSLLKLYDGPQRLEHRDLIIELCFIIPARPSTIFPFLKKQLKPIVWALESGRDNLQYGLRTLEVWIDSLQPSYLGNLLDDLEPALSLALQKHAKISARQPSGESAVRILGKLGGRSRNIVRNLVNADLKPSSVSCLSLQLTWTDSNRFAVEADAIVSQVLSILLEDRAVGSSDSAVETKLNSWQFLCCNLVPFLSIDSLSAVFGPTSADVENNFRSAARMNQPFSSFLTAKNMFVVQPGRVQQTSLLTSKSLRRSAVSLIRRILTGIIAAAGMPELSTETLATSPVGSKLENSTPRDVALGLSHYFALLHSNDLNGSARKKETGSGESTDPLSEPVHLDHDVFLDSVVEVISMESRDVAKFGLDALVAFVDSLVEFSSCSDARDLSCASAAKCGPLQSGTITASGTGINDATLRNNGKEAAAGISGREVEASMRKASMALPVHGSSVALSGGKATGTSTSAIANTMHERNPAGSNRSSTMTDESSVSGGTKKVGLGDASNSDQEVPAAFTSLTERLCHCCYQRSWNIKWAGVAALGAIISRVPLHVFQVRTSGAYEAHVVRALMFVIRDLPDDVFATVTSVARRSLNEVIKRCHDQQAQNPLQESASKALMDVTLCLTVELMSEFSNARDAAKSALEVMATSVGIDLSDLLRNAKDHIVRSLTSRNLRQCSLTVQIGYIDAVTFCLDREKPVILEELFRPPLRESFLLEVVRIAEETAFDKLTEAEDALRQKLIENNMIKPVTIPQLFMLRRRVVDFLRAIVIRCSHMLRESQNDEIFGKMISCFFRGVSSRDTDIVSSAKQGLKQAIAQHPKPKDLLQTNLRPILTYLSDHKKLSTPYLQGLSRVLELLSHWFSLQLGDKLLEHLSKWTEPEKLAQVKRWQLGTEPTVGAAILDLFHKLPPMASKFVTPVIDMVVRLEAVLPVACPGIAHRGLRGPNAASTSPYRVPLLKFCNCHPKETVAYLLTQLGQERLRHLFMVLIRADDGAPLREELASDPNRLISATFLSRNNAATSGRFAFCGVLIVNTLASHDSSWLVSNSVVMDRLVGHWSDPDRLRRLAREEFLPVDQLSEARIMAECFVRHCRDHPKDVHLLFHLLQVFSFRTLNDFSFVRDFFSDVVAKTYSTSNKRLIMSHFLKFFHSAHVSQDHKEYALQFLVIPMLIEHLEFRRRTLNEAAENRDVNRSVAGTSTKAELGETLVPERTLASEGVAGKGRQRDDSESAQEVAVANPASNALSGGDIWITHGSVGGPGSASGRQSHEDMRPMERSQSPQQHTARHTEVGEEGVLDDEILKQIMRNLMDQSDEVLRQYNKSLSAELLQLATLLVQYMPNELGGYRKELIRFGWNHLKREDSIAKQWAFVNVSRFFEAYQAPDKIILQVYVALLRYCQPDSRHLVRRALDILTPALPVRLKHNQVEHKYPIWIRYTKKILLEEAHSVPHLVHIWQLIVKHADLFYVARAQLIPIMVTSLSRICLFTNTTLENKQLALDFVELVIKWEKVRLRATSAGVGATAVASGLSSTAGHAGTKRSRDGERDDGISSSETAVPNGGSAAQADEHQERPKKFMRQEDGIAVAREPSSSNPNISDNRATSFSNDASKEQISEKPRAQDKVGTIQARQSQTSTGENDDFRPTPNMIEMVVNFVAQLAFRQLDRKENRHVAERCMLLLSSAVEVWPSAQIRLSFLDKMLDLGVNERVLPNPLGASKAKSIGSASSTPSGEGRASVSSSAAGRSDSTRNDKADSQTFDKAAVRLGALHTALKLCIILVEKQGEKFVSWNLGAIRAMVVPCLCEHNILSAKLFALLLQHLIRVCPFQPRASVQKGALVDASEIDRNQEQTIPGRSPKPASTAAPQVKETSHKEASAVVSSSMPPSATGTSVEKKDGIDATESARNLAESKAQVVRSGNPAASIPSSSIGPQKSSTHSPATMKTASGTNPAMSQDTDPKSRHVAQTNLGLESLYRVIENALERCLKGDAIAVQCGLTVLTSIVEQHPNEFPFYQDLVTKAFHRIAKESTQSVPLQIGNPAVSAGAAAGTAGATSKESHQSPPGSASSAGAVQSTLQARGVNRGSVGAAESSQSGLLVAAGLHGASSSGTAEDQVLVLGLSLLGKHILTLEPQQRRIFLQDIVVLIDRCAQVTVLLEIVRVTRHWIFWRPAVDGSHLHENLRSREPVALKEKVSLLQRMTVFERMGGQRSDELIEAYLLLVLSIFGGAEEHFRRPELLQKLERAFMTGLKTRKASTRRRFFALFNAAVDRAPFERLRYVIAKQDWESLADVHWIQQALELLLSAVDAKSCFVSENTPRLPHLTLADSAGVSTESDLERASSSQQTLCLGQLSTFLGYFAKLGTHHLVTSLRYLIYQNAELSNHVWSCIFPKVWGVMPASELSAMEGALSSLLAKEYHAVQMAWPCNVVQALLSGINGCTPIPAVPPEILMHAGCRWNAWHTALPILECRLKVLQDSVVSADVLDRRLEAKVEAELETTQNAILKMYRLLEENDFFSGFWKSRASCDRTFAALSLEQQSMDVDAQSNYLKLTSNWEGCTEPGSSGHTMKTINEAQTSLSNFGSEGNAGVAEVCLWEERWIACARKLCQWDVLTEFSRSCMHAELLHECLWRVREWGALKELLLKHPVEDGPRLKLYQSYVHLQENKLDVAESCIKQGMQRALEKFCSFPSWSGLEAKASALLQVQQFVELQESSYILNELNALSRHGAVNINVEQKIDNLRTVLRTWRERLPLEDESLVIWDDVLTWRNQVYTIIANVLEALDSVAKQTIQAAKPSVQAAGHSTTPASSQLHGVNTKGQNASAVGSASQGQVVAAEAIATALSNQQVLIMGVNETAWSVHRFARVCRKQGLPDVALSVLQKRYPFGSMELTEFFVRTKETAKAYLAEPDGIDNSFLCGLGELNRCNMDLFGGGQKSELFALKGRFLKGLGKQSEASDAFSVALKTSGDVCAAWMAWARHSDDMLKATSAHEGAQPTSSNVNRTEVDRPSQSVLLWREGAANCYLQAIKFGSRHARQYVPHVLRLLVLDLAARRVESVAPSSGEPNGPEPVAAASSAPSGGPASSGGSYDDAATDTGTFREGVYGVLVEFVGNLPPWIWLPWIIQLIPMLTRPEAPVARAILFKIIQDYPQAIFFPLRTFMDDRKGIDRPVCNLLAEALRSNRANPVSVVPGTSPRFAAAQKQCDLARSAAQQAKQHLAVTEAAYSAAVKKARAGAGSSEHQALLEQEHRLKSEVQNLQNTYDRAYRVYRNASLHQKIVATQMDSTQHAQTAKNQSVGDMSSAGSSAPVPQTSTNNTAQSKRGVPCHAPVLETVDKKAPVSRSDHLQSVSVGGERAFPPGTSASEMPRPPSAVKEASERNTSAGEHEKQPKAAPKGTQDPLKGGGQNSSNQSAAKNRLRIAPRTPYEHAELVLTKFIRSSHSLYTDMERIALDLGQRMKPQHEEQLLGLMNALLHRCYQFSVQPGREVAVSLRSALEEVSRMCFGTLPRNSTSSQPVRIQQSIADLKPAFEAELAPQTAVDFPTKIEPFIERLRRWKNIFQRRVDAMPDHQRLEMLSRHLIEIQNSDVEVFGQYIFAEAQEPSPNCHVKIDRFSADTRVVRRHSGPARGITLIGSDGNKYDFTLETSVNVASQPTEERVAQIFRLLNASMFRRHPEASRRRIRVEVPTLVPTGQHIRLVSDDPQYSSLAEGLERHMEAQQRNIDDPLMAFRKFSAEAYMRKQQARSGSQTGRKDSIAARVEAYHAVCEQHVPDSCLGRWISSSISSPSQLFAFRKSFAETLGAASIVSYVLAIGARRPQNVLFSWSSGAVSNLHMRLLLSNSGLLECDEAVPFRLTRNIRAFLGTSGLHGPLFGAMAVTFCALRANGELFETYLNGILRDELSAWILSRADGVARPSSGASGGPNLSVSSAQGPPKDGQGMSHGVDYVRAARFSGDDGDAGAVPSDNMEVDSGAAVKEGEMQKHGMIVKQEPSLSSLSTKTGPGHSVAPEQMDGRNALDSSQPIERAKESDTVQQQADSNQNRGDGQVRASPGAPRSRKETPDSYAQFEAIEWRLAESVKNIFRRLRGESLHRLSSSDLSETFDQIEERDRVHDRSDALLRTPAEMVADEVTRTVYKLIDRAGRPEYLAQMDSSWQAWF